MAGIGLATIVTILLMFVLRPLAISVGLVDRPGGRKTHHGEIPVIGGSAMYLGAALGLAVLQSAPKGLVPFLLAGALLVVTGMIDDRFDLSPYVRLLAHACAGLVMIFAAGMQITTLGSIFGPAGFDLGSASMLFTLLGTAAAINAFNMMDGMDGLAGGLAIIGLGTLAVGTALAGHGGQAVPAAVLVAAIVGFLLFNLPVQLNRRLRAFMGDAGSTFLGFAVAWFGVRFSQGDGAPLPPVVVLWASSVPLMELFSSSIRRLAAGRSPLSADADHFHHVLVRAGFSVRATFAALVGLAAALSLTGLALMLAGVPDHVSFVLFVTVTASASLVLLQSDRLAHLLPRRWKRERRLGDRNRRPTVVMAGGPDDAS